MDALHTNGCQACARSEALYRQEYEVIRKRQNQVEQLTDFLGGNPMIGHLRQLNICREVSSLANRRRKSKWQIQFLTLISTVTE